jgi:hypothetical protein
MKLMTLLLALIPTYTQAAVYSCQTEFGETVPIRKIVLKQGKQCKTCSEPDSLAPSELVETSESVDWNKQAAKAPNIDSLIKRTEFNHNGRMIYLDTRYLKRPGKTFEFDLVCNSETKKAASKCKGAFKAPSSQTTQQKMLQLEAPLYDERILPNAGEVEISLGNREHLGFIVRVAKRAVPTQKAGTMRVSSSGELKFFREDPLFIHDVGVDEQLHLFDQFYTRIAAFEAKIRCSRIDTAERLAH